MSIQSDTLTKIGILRHDREIMRRSVFPNMRVRCPVQTKQNRHGSFQGILQQAPQSAYARCFGRGEASCAANVTVPSRLDAYSSAACMSSSVNSGKTAKISSVFMPEASILRTSYTVMRMPRIVG